ncbi:MAG: hypothetical protein HN742_20525 [Lentisphaerae bacterium]|nr:hypothetical protein [Lentisphaerota bacterium]MBT4820913.1 hypothetical protein [Lentisphaerota bacterium]MBT5611517.1 hypothetical protein [Lentisphaerota bacterium]MBT7054753.1 hypothetical protein [Lentisphaerota bacterium]MBT7844277.1 hypothetical protein [Lentisphaerota bacterium]
MIECNGLEKVTGLANTTMRDFHIHATAYRESNPDPANTVAAVLARAAELSLRYVGVGEQRNRTPGRPVQLELLLDNVRDRPRPRRAPRPVTSNALYAHKR